MTVIKETEFFRLHELDDGVFAAIAKPGQGAWSNAGIVDLGDDLVVFDSFTTPTAGYELRRQAEDITGKKVKFLINSHYHGDHVFGNQAFADTTIISTSLTKHWIYEQNKMDDIEKEKVETEEYLRSLLKQIKKNQNPIIHASLTHQYNEMSKVLRVIDHLKIVLPNFIFEEKHILEGSKRNVELNCFGGGHSPSDSFMYLPKEKIAFMGDILTEDLHVPIYNPEEFQSILKKVKQMNIKNYVPGHGNVGDSELLQILSSYLSFLIKESKNALENGMELESFLTSFETPNDYKNWKGVHGIKGNLRRNYQFYKNNTKLSGV